MNNLENQLDQATIVYYWPPQKGIKCIVDDYILDGLHEAFGFQPLSTFSKYDLNQDQDEIPVKDQGENKKDCGDGSLIGGMNDLEI